MFFRAHLNPRVKSIKNPIFYFVLFQLLALFSRDAQATSFVGITLQGDTASFERVKAELKAEGHTLSLLVDRTKKFDNDNLYVELYNPLHNSPSSSFGGASQVRVVNREVILPLPAEISCDQLMEALQKVRAAKVFGANEVILAPGVPLAELKVGCSLSQELSLEQFFAVAGADRVRESSKSLRPLLEIRPKKNPVTQAGFLIGGDHHELTGKVAQLLGSSDVSFEVLRSHPEVLRGVKIYWFSASIPPVQENLFRALAQTQWLQSQGAAVQWVTPYLPYARSDKPEFGLGVAAQGRLVADLIEAVGTQGVIVARAHAPQSLGFFKIHADEISARSTLIQYLRAHQVDCVISPDAGFQKDATRYQQELSEAYGKPDSVCLVVMNKQRTAEGEQVLGGTGLEQIAGRKVVIIDDETATGGTLGHVAEAIQKYRPASVFAVVTHLAGSGQKALDSPWIEKLVVTDTLPSRIQSPKLEVVSIAEEIKAVILSHESEF